MEGREVGKKGDGGKGKWGRMEMEGRGSGEEGRWREGEVGNKGDGGKEKWGRREMDGKGSREDGRDLFLFTCPSLYCIAILALSLCIMVQGQGGREGGGAII